MRFQRLQAVLSALFLLVTIARTTNSENNVLEFAKERMDDTNTVIVTFGNSNYTQFIRNWAFSLRKLNVENFMVFSYDPWTCPALGDIPCFWDSSRSSKSRSKETLVRNSEPFLKYVMNAWLRIVRELVVGGVNVLATDGDIYFLKNPNLYLDGELMIQANAWHEYTMGPLSSVNAGYLFARASSHVHQYFDEVIELLDTNPSFHDQHGLNTILKNWATQRGWKSKIFKFFDWELFPNGGPYFITRHQTRNAIAPVIVHNNWAPNDPHKFYRFREALMWSQDDDSYYSASDRYMTYYHPGGADTGAEILALRHALSIAYALGRVLVLPRFWCGHSHRDCFLDDMMDMEALTSTFRVREHSFLVNPRTPEAVRNATDAVVIVVDSVSPPPYPEEGSAGTLSNAHKFTPRGEDGATAEELTRWLARFAHEPLLTFHGVSGRFSRFENEAKQRTLEEMLQKGMVTNPYVVGAGASLASDSPATVCVFLHAKWARAQAKAIAAVLSRREVPSTPIYVAIQVEDRSQGVIEPLVAPLRRYFDNLRYIDRNTRFPGSDLYRLGIHPMVTGIEEALCTHAQAFYYPVTRHPLSSFPDRVCEAREAQGRGCVPVEPKKKRTAT